MKKKKSLLQGPLMCLLLFGVILFVVWMLGSENYNEPTSLR